MFGPDDMPDELKQAMLADIAAHQEREDLYKAAAGAYQFRVRVIQVPGDSWTYLANSVEVQREPGESHMGMYRIKLTDAWTPAKAARELDEVDCTCVGFTIEKCTSRELTAAAFMDEVSDQVGGGDA